MRKFMAEFKEFALRGNVMDLAIGVIIGAAFQAVVSSLTENILSPLIGLLTRQNFDTLEVTVFGGVVIKYGAFITSLVNFVIMALVVFVIVKMLNKLAGLGKAPEVEPEPTTKECPYCISDIALDATRCPHCTSQL